MAYIPQQQFDDHQITSHLLSKLPEALKKVIRLYYFDGYTFSEIADEFDCSRTWAQTLHREALCRMRRELFVRMKEEF